MQLRSRKGEWFAVRLDMEVPGALLLRDGKGNIYAIETEGLPQVGGAHGRRGQCVGAAAAVFLRRM